MSEKRQQGFAVTGQKDAAEKGTIGGTKTKGIKKASGFKVAGDPREAGRLGGIKSGEARRARAAAKAKQLTTE